MTRYHALVPAGGSGSRFAAGQRKQYTPLLGQPLLHHALGVLAADPRITQVHLLLAEGDSQWHDGPLLALHHRVRVHFCAGETRAATVARGLDALAGEIAGEDWILVHDAARPCLTAALLDRLLTEVGDDAVGGLLAVPISDTVKRELPAPDHRPVADALADAAAAPPAPSLRAVARVGATLDRAGLWAAQTPQMFRYGLLKQALASTGGAPSDEAGAVEALGHQPLLVRGAPSNLKVTYPEDLRLAEAVLRAQASIP